MQSGLGNQNLALAVHGVKSNKLAALNGVLPLNAVHHELVVILRVAVLLSGCPLELFHAAVVDKVLIDGLEPFAGNLEVVELISGRIDDTLTPHDKHAALAVRAMEGLAFHDDAVFLKNIRPALLRGRIEQAKGFVNAAIRELAGLFAVRHHLLANEVLSVVAGERRPLRILLRHGRRLQRCGSATYAHLGHERDTVHNNHRTRRGEQGNLAVNHSSVLSFDLCAVLTRGVARSRGRKDEARSSASTWAGRVGRSTSFM